MDDVRSGTFVLAIGTVAFLLTDVEGSSGLWAGDPDAMTAAMECHYAVLDAVISAHGGVRPLEQDEGDCVVAAFSTASEAVLAARDAQVAFGAQQWPTAVPVKVRMAIHAGEARVRDGASYAGETIIRTARLRALGHGGQVLVSGAARDLVVDHVGDSVEFMDLGVHRLKDLARPEHVWQLAAAGLDRQFLALSSLDAVANNLPSSLSRFIGRAADVATVARLVDADRVVTLTGSGGAGKTRLALAVAAEIIEQFPDGVWWVELAPVERGDLVALAVAEALGVRNAGLGDPLAQVLRRLAGRAPLVVVDNAEHLIDDVARVVHAIASSCPLARFLVTSRRALEIPGEVTWRVPSLDLPARHRTATPIEVLGQFDSVSLFVDRARRTRSTFALNDTNGATIAEICHRLDGIPLAIELAASRCRSLSPGQILDGLAQGPGLLTAGARTVLPRQQTLEASIRWSHDLLTGVEQRVLRRVSVFTGGWTLTAAEAVAAADDIDNIGVLDALDRLVQHSLVQLDDVDGVPRYRMLEMVRQFLAGELEASGETAAVRDRHARWVIALLNELGEWSLDDRVFDVWAVLEPEITNISAGIAHACRIGHHEALAHALDAMYYVFTYTCRYTLRERFETPLVAERDKIPAPARAHFAARAFLGALLLGRVSQATTLASEARALATELGEEHTLLLLDITQVMLQLTTGSTPELETAAKATLHRARALDDAELVRFALYTLIGTYVAVGRPVDAEPYLIEYRTLDRPPAMWPSDLMWEGTYARMSGRMRDSLDIYRQLDAINERGRALPQPVVRAGHAWSAFECGEPDPDEAILDDLYHAAELDDSPADILGLQFQLGLRALHHGDLDTARDWFNRAREPNPRGLVAIWADERLAFTCAALGDRDGARDAIERLHATGQPLRTVNADLAEGWIAIHDGDLNRAEIAIHHATTTATHNGLHAQLVTVLELHAAIAEQRNAPIDATRLLATAHRYRNQLGLHGGHPTLTNETTTRRQRLRQVLGDTEYDTATRQGHELDLDHAIALLQRTWGARKRPAFGWDALTPTEHLVIHAITTGATTTQAAKQLLISPETVKTHLTNIYTKLAIHNRAQLVTTALANKTN